MRRLFLLDSFRSAAESEKKSCIQMRDLLGNKGKRVEVDVSKRRFGQASNIKKEVNTFVKCVKPNPQELFLFIFYLGKES